MNSTATGLPAGFEALEPFVAKWAVEGANNRAQLRLTSNAPERVAFFEAGKPLVAPALALLDQKPLEQLDAPEQRLMLLMLSFAHVALAVEMQGDAERKHAAGARFMRITRAPADGAARELQRRVGGVAN
jgi:hypothetical protein